MNDISSRTATSIASRVVLYVELGFIFSFPPYYSPEEIQYNDHIVAQFSLKCQFLKKRNFPAPAAVRLEGSHRKKNACFRQF